MIKYSYLSDEDKLSKSNEINMIPKVKLDDEYIAMKNELNNISSIKNNYIIALFAGIIAFWGYLFPYDDQYDAYMMLLPHFFIYVIQDRLMMLTNLHIKIQAQIWVIYQTFYESSIMSLSKAIFGSRKQTFFSRLRKIPAFYMGTINVLIALIKMINKKMTNSDTYHWVIVLCILIVFQIAIFIKFWKYSNGVLTLLSYAEEMKDNSDINYMKEKRKSINK